MNPALGLVFMLCAVVAVAVLARRFHIPYPIACVVAGIGLSFVHGAPHPVLEPDLFFLFVLPPLLYGAAWDTDWHEFKRNIRPIFLLAVGLVIFTTAIVAVVVHATIPGFTWALAFTLGAIVSPPDAVAAEAIFERLPVPRRIAAIVSGECLVNDATALVLYRFAVAAIASSTFVAGQVTLAFFVVAIGGIVAGLAIAFAAEAVIRIIVRRGYDQPTLINVVLLIVPFASYLVAEDLNVSGVLSAVTAGMLMSRRMSSIVDSGTRLLGTATWEMMLFILNAFVFLLIGLQLPQIVAGLEHELGKYVLDGLIVSALVIVVRLAWVFPATYVPRWLSKRLRERDPAPPWQATLVIGWAGMRGIISLAAALGIAYDVGVNDAPVRSEIIFITFCVIIVTLVGQGLTLGPLIRWLGVEESSASNKRETELRVRALEEGIARLRALEPTYSSPHEWEIAGRVLGEYEHRIAHLRGKLDASDESTEIAEIATDRRLQKEALDAERRAIARMRAAGEIPDDIFRSIENDLDLAAVQLG
jgi:CPA1 family monovalent cation:H+ antiporter